MSIKGDVIYLKKDWTGWRVIEPIKDPKTKKIIWKNVFSKKGFLSLGVLLIILISLYLAFNESVNNYKEIMENPCEYCITCYQKSPFSDLNITLTPITKGFLIPDYDET